MVKNGTYLLTFQDKLSVASLRVKQDRSDSLSQKSVNKYQSILCNIPEELRSYLCHGKKPVITHGLESSRQRKLLL